MALVDALHGLLRLPGATYSCVVERDSGRVLAETGDGAAGAGDGEGVVPFSVARWGTAVAAMFDATAGDDLDDVMIAGKRSYHLLRPLGPTASVLVYLRLDRARSNLAVARRELGAVRWGTAAADPPAPRGAVELRAVPSPREARAPERRPDPVVAAARPLTRITAALPPPGTPARGMVAVGAAAAARGAGPAGRGAAPVIPLPRRGPARSLSDTAQAAPEGFAMPSVLGQTWARDPGTLRRLIAGLRRLS